MSALTPTPISSTSGAGPSSTCRSGLGVHFCLGAALARMEGRIALEETLARFPDWRADTDRAVRLHTSTVRGYKSVPVLI